MRRLIQRGAGLTTRITTRIPAGLRVTLAYALAIAWTKALAMLTVPMLTGMLSPADYGRLELLSSAGEIGGLIAGAGLVDTLFRFGGAPGTPAGAQTARVAGLALMISCGVLALVAALSGQISAAMPLATPRGDILLLGAAVALESAIGVPLGWLRMNRRAGSFAAITMLRATLQAGLVVALVWTGHGVEGVLWAGCVSCIIIASLLTVRQARETGLGFAPRESLRLLGYGLPLLGGGLASFVLGTADRWLLAGQVSPEQLGHYGLAAKVALIVALVAQPFELWWYPQRIALSRSAEGIARSGRVVGAGAAALMLAGAAIALAAPTLVGLLAPASYAPAASMVAPLVLALVCQLLSSMANVGCYARASSTQPMAVNAAAAGVALIFYLLLIPGMGVRGAIIATVISQAARLAMFATLSQRSVRIVWPLRRLLATATAAIATGAVPLLLAPGLNTTLLGGALLALTALLATVTILDPMPRPRILRAMEA